MGPEIDPQCDHKYVNDWVRNWSKMEPERIPFVMDPSAFPIPFMVLFAMHYLFHIGHGRWWPLTIERSWLPLQVHPGSNSLRTPLPTRFPSSLVSVLAPAEPFGVAILRHRLGLVSIQHGSLEEPQANSQVVDWLDSWLTGWINGWL